MNWLVIHGGEGFSFAAPNSAAYRSRLFQAEPVKRENFTVLFTLTEATCDPKSLPGGDLSTVFAQRAVDEYAEEFVNNTLKSKSPFVRLDLSSETQISLGRFSNSGFVSEERLAARSIRLIQSTPSPTAADFGPSLSNASAIFIREVRHFQLWQGIFFLVPCSPPRVALVQAFTPEIPISLEYTTSNTGTYPTVFPSTELMETITDYVPAIISNLFDTGKIVRL